MNRFFITGLPRSRTTWMSNLMTYDDSFCFHDGIRCGVDALLKSMDEVQLKYPHLKSVGDSDSALLLFADKLVERIPSARWLFISKPEDQCVKSYLKHFEEYDPYCPEGADIKRIMSAAAEKYQSVKKIIPIFREIKVEALDDLCEIRECWDWLTHGSRFNQDRAEMLNAFQLNPFPKKTKSFDLKE